MKRKAVMAVILSAMMVAGVALAGCGNKSTSSASSASSTSATSSSVESTSASSTEDGESAEEDELANIPVVEEDVSLEDCVDLGEYKGLKLTKSITEVTDEEAKTYAEDSAELKEVEDENATAANGQFVNIDFAGTVDGKEFDGGTSESYELELGSKSMIDGFEDGIVGMKKGDEKDLNLKFPDDYYSEDLAGKDVVFHVKVNSILEKAEVTDEDIQNAKEELTKNYADSSTEQLRYDAWDQVLAATTVKQFRKADLDKTTEQIDKDTKEWIDAMGSTMEEYLESIGETQEEYDAEMESYARNTTKEQMIVNLIAEKEGLSIEDPEQEEAIQKYADDYGIDVTEFKEQYGEESINQSVLMQRVLEKIVSYAEVTEETVADDSADEVIDDSGITIEGEDGTEVEAVSETDAD